MMKRVLLTATLAIVSCAAQLCALPADPTPRVVTQPDGSTITVSLHGDEYGSWWATSAGRYVTLCPDGFYRYTTLTTDGELVASNVIARDGVDVAPAQATQGIADRMAAMRKANFEARSYESRPQGAPLRKQALRAADEPVVAKGIVLLVQFQDVKFSENGTVENIWALMNEEGNDYMGAIGSARDYFMDQSYGKFIPEFDVVGPITVSENESYYGSNSGGADDQPYKMVIEACDIAHEQGLCDFSQYDADGDGVIDLVFVVYAGYAESAGAPSWTIWPHASWIASVAHNVYNGVTIDAYACTSELAGTTGTDLYGIGAICHEYSHTLGLPDFYDTLGGGSLGMGCWSIMDQGCYNFDSRIPAGYSAYERDFCGWMQIEELTTAQSVTLPNLADYGIAYKIVSSNPDRYFTLETRTQTGWDAYLPAQGLLITKIDYVASRWESNQVNTVKSRQGVQFVPADDIVSATTYEGDLWPYNGANSFTENTEPAMKIYLTTIRNKPMTDIYYDEANSWVTFDFMGGTPAGAIEAPVALLPNVDSDNSFVAAWSPVEGALSYTLCVVNNASQEQRIIEDITDTQYRVTDLEVGNYTYMVCAVGATAQSDYSNAIEVTLSASVSTIATQAARIYATDGNIVVRDASATTAHIYNMQGMQVATLTPRGGVATFAPRVGGIYIVRCGATTARVVVK